MYVCADLSMYRRLPRLHGEPFVGMPFVVCRIASLEQELDALQCDHEEVVRSNVGKAAIVAELRSKVESADAKAKAEMKLLSKEIKSLRKEIKVRQ